MSGDTVDWNTVKVVLTRISEGAGDFLEENILIGGAAAWFYRSLLENARDVDFPAPVYSKEEDRIWLSKDDGGRQAFRLTGQVKRMEISSGNNGLCGASVRASRNARGELPLFAGLWV